MQLQKRSSLFRLTAQSTGPSRVQRARQDIIIRDSRNYQKCSSPFLILYESRCHVERSLLFIRTLISEYTRKGTLIYTHPV